MTMTTEELDSRNLLRVTYDPEALRLEVVFRKGARRYAYEGVTPDVFYGLLAADSKGRYFIEHIKSRYPFARLEDTPVVVDAGEAAQAQG